MSTMSPSAASPRRTSNPTNGTTSRSSPTADASGLSDTLQSHVDDIRGLLQCGVCIRPLYEPFTLACGHTFCYSCLTSWFSGGRSNKTCPDCRAAVKSQPAPAYLVRTLVQLFTGRAELLDGDETTTEHANNQRDEAQRVETDRNNPNPANGGLFRGTFNRDRAIARPIVDLEDNVVRCPNCSWELEEGNDCTQCGYRQDNDSLSDSMDYMNESEGMSEMTDDFEDGYEDAFADLDEFGWNELVDAFPAEMDALGMPYRGPFGRSPFFSSHHLASIRDSMSNNWQSEASRFPQRSVSRTTDETGESEDSDNSEMDSFIDDDERGEDGFSGSDRSTVVGAHDFDGSNGTPHPFSSDIASSTVSAAEEESGLSSEEDSEEEDDDDEPVRSAVTSRHHRSIPAPDEQPQTLRTLMSMLGQHPGREDRVFRPSHPSRSQSSSTRRHGRSRPQRNESRGTSVSTAINVDDDSDESDEGPVGPMRRARDRGSRRQRAY